MILFGANHISEGSFMPTFKKQGQIHHHIGSLSNALICYMFASLLDCRLR